MIVVSLRPREVDWNRPDWGGHVTVGCYVPDAHDLSEAVDQ